MSIEQLSRQLETKQRKCAEARGKISYYGKIAANESEKSSKASRAAERTKNESTIRRKKQEAQQHQKRANDAMNSQSTWQKKLYRLESDIARLMRKLNDARTAESKKIAKETDRKIGAINPLEINVNAPLVDGDNFGNVAVGQNIQQSQVTTSSSNDLSALRDVLKDILDRLDALELTDEDRQDLRETVTESISELESDTPDAGKLRTPLRLIKRILTPIGSSMVAGTAAGAGILARQWIEQLAQFL
ncbi:hypothetical protein [Bifidobacterium vansinderenii]|nr:hypothetical protein [Bifidobacterium vansinderenii]